MVLSSPGTSSTGRAPSFSETLSARPWVAKPSGIHGDLLAGRRLAPRLGLVAGDREVRAGLGDSGDILVGSDRPTGPPRHSIPGGPVSDGSRYLLGGGPDLPFMESRFLRIPLRPLDPISQVRHETGCFDLTTTTAAVTQNEVSLVDGMPVYNAVTNIDHSYVTVGDLGTILTSGKRSDLEPRLNPRQQQPTTCISAWAAIPTDWSRWAAEA